jgi:hypothetical protein
MVDYIRRGKDIHARTASLIYNVPEGTYGKGTSQRDIEAKMSNFLKLYGGGARALYDGIRNQARLLTLTKARAKEISAKWEAGHPGAMELYDLDARALGERGYCEDGYGRRRWVGVPDGVRYLGVQDGKAAWAFVGRTRDDRGLQEWQLEKRKHIMANTPTQGMSATDVLWMLALLYHGEYTPLVVPGYWEASGVAFPEAAGWQLHEGEGPGGKPFLSWHSNTVHDSGWGDCAPGYLEPTMKVVYRRCTAVPFDWRLEADVPYRIDLSVGPDFANLMDYNTVAAKFGLEPMPKR